MEQERQSLEQIKAWLHQEIDRLFPLAVGSLSRRRSPCVREHCPACASGEQHLSYVLYGRDEKSRYAIYIPDELAPQIQQAVSNGRMLQALLKQVGVRCTKALKQERTRRRQAKHQGPGK
jgi:hypothetical protein